MSTLIVDLPLRFNLRDLGGLGTTEGAAVAPGRLYRGASLHHLGPGELEQLRRLGLKTVIDLRTSEELGDPTYPPLPELEARSLPMFQQLPDLPAEPEDASALMVDLYLTMLTGGAKTIVAVLEVLADPAAYPVAFYCAAGKDRTGVMAALVLGLLGVEEDQIVADYTLSDEPAAALRRWIAANHPGRDDLVPAGIYRAQAATMRRFLDQIEKRYGSIGGYVGELGVSDETREAIAVNLLAPASGR